MEELNFKKLESITLVSFLKSDIIEDKIINNILSVFKNPSLADLINLDVELLKKAKGLGLKKIDNIILLTNELKNNPDKYIDYYNLFHSEIFLPIKNTPANDIIDRLNLCLIDFLNILSIQGEIEKAKVLNKYFSINNETEYSISEIGSSIGKTKQRIDQIAMNESGLKELFSGGKYKNISINQTFLSELL